MTMLDWFLVAFVTLLAIYGYAQGFIVGALSLAGFAAGAFLGTRIAPHLLSDGSRSPYAPLFGLAGALAIGGILAIGFEGVALMLRRRLTKLPVLGALDGLLGATLTACIALGIVWIGGAVALQVPQTRGLRRDIQRSVILRRLNETLPPSGAILNALARLDPFPRINGPRANVGPPPTGVARDPDVRAASGSVVRVLGSACGLGLEGSGWVAAPGIVVTNAHVVAGERDTTVQPGGSGPKLDARAVHFDARNDIAILRVPGLGRRALRLADSAPVGAPAAVLGYPENGPYDAEPARLGPTASVISQDAYGRGPVTRRITSLRARVRHGNSGGPVVNADGRVVATIFAATVGATPAGGFGVPIDVLRSALRDTSGSTSTGPCAP